jgi:hypothetical protein
MLFMQKILISNHALGVIEGKLHDFSFVIPAKAGIQGRLFKPALST